MTSHLPLRFGPYRLDPSEKQLFRDGEPVHLTPKVFDLLLILIENRSSLLSKEELMNALWPGVTVVEANLTQSISTLRRALENGEYIETIPKRGYRWVAKVHVAAEDEERRFPQLTFGSGPVNAARFIHSGSFAFDAAWDGRPMDVFVGSGFMPEGRPLGFENAGLMAVSPGGELAACLRRRFVRGYVHSGTLALVQPAGGAPRERLDGIQWADFSPDGRLAVVTEGGGLNKLEFPEGNVIYRTGGWISHARVSPSGDRIAFIDHRIQADDRGEVAIIDLSGKKTALSGEYTSVQGLAWSASGQEVWYTAARSGNSRTLYAVGLDGQKAPRPVLHMPGGLTLHDVSRDGRVLLTRDLVRVGISFLGPGEEAEKDLHLYDWSLASDLSPDGRWLLFTEAGEAGGTNYGVFLRPTSSADPKDVLRLGEGTALALSPDMRWALAKAPGPPTRLTLLPCGAGTPIPLEGRGLYHHPWACFFPSGRQILFCANEAGRGARLYVQDIAGGPPRSITPEIEGIHLTTPHAISPDEPTIAAVGPDHQVCLYPTEGGECRVVEGTCRGDIPVGWDETGEHLYIRRSGAVPAEVYKLNLKTGAGREKAILRLIPHNPAGVYEVLRVLLTPGGESYAYTFTRHLSYLHLAEGLR